MPPGRVTAGDIEQLGVDEALEGVAYVGDRPADHGRRDPRGEVDRVEEAQRADS